MKSITKLFITVCVALTIIAGSVITFAESQYSTPAEAVAGLTARDAQSVIDERARTGKTYGAIANEAGVLDEFKTEMLKIRKDMLTALVAAGTMTQKQADEIFIRIIDNMSVCAGAGTGCVLYGAGRGMGTGRGMGAGRGRGAGRGMGADPWSISAEFYEIANGCRTAELP